MTRLTPRDIAGAAHALGCEVAQIMAVVEVETGGKSGFLDDGRPRLLYEPHIFFRRTNGRYGERAPISAKAWGTFPYGTLSEQWRRFLLAAELDRQAAIESCSWGLFQILGQNWQALGYGSAEAFFDAMHEGEAAHLDSFLRFVRANNLTDALRAGNREANSWREFARRYNGPGYASHNYHGRLAAAYAKHADESDSDARYRALLSRGDAILPTFTE